MDSTNARRMYRPPYKSHKLHLNKLKFLYIYIEEIKSNLRMTQASKKFKLQSSYK